MKLEVWISTLRALLDDELGGKKKYLSTVLFVALTTNYAKSY